MVAGGRQRLQLDRVSWTATVSVGQPWLRLDRNGCSWTSHITTITVAARPHKLSRRPPVSCHTRAAAVLARQPPTYAYTQVQCFRLQFRTEQGGRGVILRKKGGVLS